MQGALAEAVTGIYSGFASVGASDEVFKMCMSIGWNPFYKNQRKTVEPWILHSFAADFYGALASMMPCPPPALISFQPKARLANC